ncbi:hypothetical protein L0657_04570 [Dyadobacter sp. CY345]|uniref:hypothetical protein n=1 Tax=Dyadobacter sp. CY345 TaxID=2909335 RepID=UPI001F4089C9|nr:hypothetical protein [Dyadobacter sp. CY345]MCF2443221.1 hypothetical protein [Dyadobacter sp. CY345]
MFKAAVKDIDNWTLESTGGVVAYNTTGFATEAVSLSKASRIMPSNQLPRLEFDLIIPT